MIVKSSCDDCKHREVCKYVDEFSSFVGKIKHIWSSRECPEYVEQVIRCKNFEERFPTAHRKIDALSR